MQFRIVPDSDQFRWRRRDLTARPGVRGRSGSRPFLAWRKCGNSDMDGWSSTPWGPSRAHGFGPCALRKD